MATIQGLTKDGMLAIAAEIDTKVSKSGDTMTGALVLPADPTSNLEAATKQYVDNVAINTANLYDIDYVKFDTTYAGGSTLPGQLAWDQDNETLEFMLDDHVTLQIGQEHVMRVKNNSGSVAIPERTVVMFAGAAGDTIKVSPAVSDGSINVNYLAGITTEQIPADGFGFITQLGFINQVNTNSWPVGTLLYVDPTVPGGLTSTEPESPAWVMPVAAVTKQNASAGRILVRAIPGGSAGGGASVNVSDTTPAGGNKGDLWYDSTDGTMYVYYEDVDGSQWVQIRANSALEASILERLGSLEAQAIAYGTQSPNYLINGGMDIWQRGTSFTTANGVGYFAADRWCIYSNPGRTWSRVSAGLTGFNYAFRVQRNSGNTDTYNTTILQMIESANMLELAGKTVTLSFYARKGADYSTTGSKLYAYSNTGTGVDQNILTGYTGSASAIYGEATLTTSWQRFSFTGTLSSNATEMMVGFYGSPVGTASTNDYYEITGIQLERGTTATLFRRNGNSIAEEVLACQRYYSTSYMPGTPAGSLTWVGALQSSGVYEVTTTSYLMCPFSLPVPMRTSPTMVAYSPLTGAANKVVRDRIGVSSSDADVVFTDISNRQGISYSSSGQIACRIVYHFTASAEI